MQGQLRAILLLFNARQSATVCKAYGARLSTFIAVHPPLHTHTPHHLHPTPDLLKVQQGRGLHWFVPQVKPLEPQEYSETPTTTRATR